MVLVHEHLVLHHDARDTLDARRRAYGDAKEGASCGYHPHRGGRYDSGEDGSPSPDLMGPQAFGEHAFKSKAKQDEDADEGASKPPNKRKNKRWRGSSLVANADRPGG